MLSNVGARGVPWCLVSEDTTSGGRVLELAAGISWQLACVGWSVHDCIGLSFALCDLYRYLPVRVDGDMTLCILMGARKYFGHNHFRVYARFFSSFFFLFFFFYFFIKG